MEKVEKVYSLADIANYIEVTHVRKAYCDYLHFLTTMEKMVRWMRNPSSVICAA